MPVSGLVITLAPSADHGCAAWASLEECPAIELGTREGFRVAAVLSTTSENENKAMWQWLNGRPEIDHVDVFFVSMETESDDGSEQNAPKTLEMCRG